MSLISELKAWIAKRKWRDDQQARLRQVVAAVQAAESKVALHEAYMLSPEVQEVIEQAPRPYKTGREQRRDIGNILFKYKLIPAARA